MLSRTYRTTCLLAILSLSIFPASVARSQILEQVKEPPTVPQTLMFIEMLEGDQTIAESINDPMWNLKAGSGRILIELPIQFGPVAEPTEVKSPGIDLGSSRFVCWRIDPKYSTIRDDQAEAPAETDLEKLTPLQRSDLLLLSPDRIKEIYGESGPTPSRVQGTSDGPAESARRVRTVLPETASRLAREITVMPDGSVKWSLARAIPGMDIDQGDDPYKLKLRSSRLRDMRPERQVRPARQAGEDARDYRERVREVEDRYRDEMQKYRELSTQVRELPEAFVVGELDRVFAVFELAGSIRNLKLEGPAPLPWEPTFETFRDIRQWLKTPPQDTQTDMPGLTNEQLKVIQTLDNSLDTSQPLSYEAAAMVLDRMNVVPGVESGSSLYGLLQRIVKGPSQNGRLLVVEDLSATLPPSEATSNLLAEASEFMSSAEQWATLNGMLTAELADEKSQQLLIDAANRVLRDPQGQAVFDVLAVLTTKANANDALNEMLIRKMDFAAMPLQRRKQAYRFVARYASLSPAVADWLQDALLRQPGLAPETLDAISTIRENESGFVLGAWPIRGVDDGLIVMLSDKDQAVNNAAWQALPGFTLAPQARQQTLVQRAGKAEQNPTEAKGQPSETGPPPARDVIEAIVNAALSQPTTPRTLVPFLVAQDQGSSDSQRPTDLTDRVTLALLRVMQHGDMLGKQQAVAVLIGSERPLIKGFLELDPAKREAVLRELWAVRGEMSIDQTPLLLGMVRQSPFVEPMVALLSDPKTANPLPPVTAMAQALGDEASLLREASGQDTAVRRAAVAALVVQTGGDETAARKLAERFILSPDQTDNGLRKLWSQAREELVMATLSNAQGRYRLILTIAKATPEEPNENNPDKKDAEEDNETKAYQLGIADLQVEGTSVSFNNGLILKPLVETSQLAIEEPGTLKMFDVEGLADLPLEEAEKPWKLSQDTDGVWSGDVKLPDDKTATFQMTPVQIGDGG